jgi:hypothetical protein
LDSANASAAVSAGDFRDCRQTSSCITQVCGSYCHAADCKRLQLLLHTLLLHHSQPLQVMLCNESLT